MRQSDKGYKQFRDVIDRTPAKDIVDKIEETTDGILEQLIEELGGIVENPKVIYNIAKKLSNRPELIKILLMIVKTYYSNLPAGAVLNKVDLNPEEYLHAKIASLAYNPVDSFDLNGKKYIKDKDLSDENSVVYYPEAETNTAIIGYRGTKPSNASDLISDVFIALGETEYSVRFKDALNKYYTVKKKYQTCSITGHSLGSSQANFVGRKTGALTYGFNGGWGLDKNYSSWLNKFKNIKTYKIEGDPISMFFGIENIANIRIFNIGKSGFAAHSMENFL